MKKFVCMALSAALLAGSVPAYAAEESLLTKIPHTFTARVGTTRFTKDGEAQALDVPIYTKDGYVMLPLRTFMQALDADAELAWSSGTGLAEVTLHDFELTFDVNGNRILTNARQLPVFGQMELKDGRVFVPLRDWEGVLKCFSCYVVDADALRWDAATKTATVQLTELTTENDISSVKGTGEAAVFGITPTERYDYIDPIGDGYFIAKKYSNPASDAQKEDGAKDTEWFLLDQQGKVLLRYDSKELAYLGSYRDGFLRMEKRDGTRLLLDRAGNTQFADVYSVLGEFSDGLAMVMNDADGKCGYVDTKGALVIPRSFDSAKAFSDGLAAAGVDKAGKKDTETRYGYIDQRGNWVIEPKYQQASAFQDGLAKVTDTEGNTGFIDKTGQAVIPLCYSRITDFWEGKAFAQEKSGEIFLIDKTGKKLKSVATGKSMNGWDNGIISVEMTEQVAADRTEVVTLYFDENGRISQADAEWRMQLSEGLAPCRDEKTGKYGYVGEDGTWVIAPAFDSVSSFRDGYAVVSRDVTLADGTRDVQWGTVCHPI